MIISLTNQENASSETTARQILRQILLEMMSGSGTMTQIARANLRQFFRPTNCSF